MSEIQNLEQEIKDYEKLVELRTLALNLSVNPDFRKLFMDEYFVKEAARLVHLSEEPNLDEKQRADALAMAKATGHVKRWLSAQIQMGAHAERALPEMQATLVELRAEEDAR